MFLIRSRRETGVARRLNDNDYRQMRRLSKRSGLLVLGLAAAGCTDKLPTLTDPDLFPGSLPTTIQYTIPAADVLGSVDVIPGRTTVFDAFYKLLALDFDGALNSHLLAQFNGFPKAVTLDVVDDSTYTYEPSFVVATLPDTLRVTATQLAFQLWTVVQPFDSVDVSWENAVDRPGEVVPWTQPGGTGGTLLGTAFWQRSAEGAGADSLRWSIPASVVTALADSSLAGLMVILATPGARAEISSLAIEAYVRPESKDTVVTQTVQSLAQTFVMTPAPEKPADLVRIGGISSDRATFRLRLDNPLVGCADPTPGCPAELDLSEVTLNRVELLLEPVPVTGGYRPITPTLLSFRRLLEPELGPRATLAEIVSQDTISVSRFLPGNTDPIVLDLTFAVANALANDEDELTLAALIEPEASTPSYVWVRRNPRLRFTYTLPQRPQLP